MATFFAVNQTLFINMDTVTRILDRTEEIHLWFNEPSNDKDTHGRVIPVARKMIVTDPDQMQAIRGWLGRNLLENAGQLEPRRAGRGPE